MNKRFNIDWDNKLTQEQLINLILTDEDLPKLRSLTIGNWGDCWENETCQPIIDMIVENAPPLYSPGITVYRRYGERRLRDLLD